MRSSPRHDSVECVRRVLATFTYGATAACARTVAGRLPERYQPGCLSGERPLGGVASERGTWLRAARAAPSRTGPVAAGSRGLATVPGLLEILAKLLGYVPEKVAVDTAELGLLLAVDELQRAE